MNNAAVIAEYNPFHNGHLHQLNILKELKADSITVCMNGNFVQRCEPAIIEKHKRAEAAIYGGADLVVELPFRYGIASAEHFAFGAVSILNQLMFVDTLCFGSESGDINTLKGAVSALELAEAEGYIAKHIKSGISYAEARQRAVFEAGCNFSIKNPNDILAIEYIKALKKLQSPIKPFAIKRIGGYHSLKAVKNILSASAIRNLIKEDKPFSCYITEKMNDIILEKKEEGKIASIKNIERSILACIRSYALLKDKDFSKIYGIKEGLENRIFKYSYASSLDELYEAVKTKRYAMSTVRRAVFCLYFGIKNQMNISPPYVHVLAFNNKGRELLRDLKSHTNIFHTLPPKTDGLIAEFIKEESLASDIYNLAYNNAGKSGCEHTTNSIYIDLK